MLHALIYLHEEVNVAHRDIKVSRAVPVNSVRLADRFIACETSSKLLEARAGIY